MLRLVRDVFGVLPNCAWNSNKFVVFWLHMRNYWTNYLSIEEFLLYIYMLAAKFRTT